MDELHAKNNIPGKYDLVDFLNRVWNLDSMPSSDSRFMTASGDIWQHMINNSDWDEVYLYEKYLELMIALDEVFIKFLEQVVHPLVRQQEEQDEYIDFINKHLENDGFKFNLADNISGFPVYRIDEVLDGVIGNVKNLIFLFLERVIFVVGYKSSIL
ncbi:hypothetical protein [Brevibacillus fortis]|uniref:AbiJ-related protein n=1 Tax=Brevibacillus fortis TaxID=2126352 RepID=UPI0038FC6C5E